MRKEINTKVKKRVKKSFSMLEAILSVAIVSIGLVGALSLLSKSTKESMDSRDQVIAGMLAQEGVEIVRNIRDNNWANNSPIDSFSGLNNGSYSCDYKIDCASSVTYQLYLMDRSGNLFYERNSSGTATKFFRRITISTPAANFREIESMVMWDGTSTFQTESNCVTANKCAYTKTTLSKWGE